MIEEWMNSLQKIADDMDIQRSDDLFYTREDINEVIKEIKRELDGGVISCTFNKMDRDAVRLECDVGGEYNDWYDDQGIQRVSGGNFSIYLERY